MLTDAGVFGFGLWLDAGRLHTKSNRQMHPIVLFPLGLPAEAAVSARATNVIGYLSQGASEIEAMRELGRSRE